MRILVITRTAWRKDNSLGNTYSNLFCDLEDIQIGNIYLGDGLPDANNSNVVSYYRISEKEIIQNLFNCKKIGRRITEEELINQKKENKEEIYIKALAGIKKVRWPVFFLLRELVWKLGHPNLNDLMKYVRDFDPDLIFLSFYYAAYADRIALYIKSRIDVPMVLEAAIDIYSMKQLSFDPFFWVNRLNIRRMIRKTVKRSEKLYVISEKMKNDYEKILKLPCSVLYKFPDYSRKLYDYQQNDGKLVFLYTGNIGIGRWKSIGLIGKVVKEAEIGTVKVFTPTPLTEKMKKHLRDCEVLPPISAEQVIVEQNKADILIHAESFDLANKLEVRYSISTKIMDYLSAVRCILAVGPKDIASIEYLEKNDLAFVCHGSNEIEDVIYRIKKDNSIIKNKADYISSYVNAIDRKKIQQEFRDDMQRVVNQSHNMI